MSGEETSDRGRSSRRRPGSSSTRAGIVAAVVAISSVLSVQTFLSSSTQPASASTRQRLAPLDPEVVLPPRVAASLERTLDAVDRASGAVDDRLVTEGSRSLEAAARNFLRAHKAGTRQLQAPPPGEEAEESTAGPDSVLAVLAVEQDSVARLAALYDRIRSTKVLASLTRALVAAQTQRAKMLDAVIALPEEARLPYADGLADTVPAYTDEVAGLTEALADDTLTTASRSALRAALSRSKSAEAKMTAAFGGED